MGTFKVEYLFILTYVTVVFFFLTSSAGTSSLTIDPHAHRTPSCSACSQKHGVLLGKTKYMLWFVELIFTVQCNFRRRPGTEENIYVPDPFVKFCRCDVNENGLFWDLVQSRIEFLSDVSGQFIDPIFEG